MPSSTVGGVIGAAIGPYYGGGAKVKSTTATARAMSDPELMNRSLQLRKEIPAAQALLDAIKREQRARKRRAAKKA